MIDLTCEFSEPHALRESSYFCFPVLDRSVPSLDDLRSWIERIAALEGNILIHCAEGHGRTGLFAAALLVHTGQTETPESALQFIQSKRPLVRLSHLQMKTLMEFSGSH
ncbi:dual specificity protein phosphatase family protein [uncultured Gimesia sp.]|uniref:dual specificity protein phosphatase family protein n=1 Tax=uncultured Gimesia sp. TaxID=1678688 RepID=UPI00261E8443|nr:dual specificity protein phosphatase family protein [uncultured Gimesia sp.]